MSKVGKQTDRRGRGKVTRKAGGVAREGDSRPLADRLPPFVVVAVGVSGNGAKAATLRCPRRDCGCDFIVNREAFKTGRAGAEDYGTRPCPYCFRVSSLPSTAPVLEPHTP